MLHQAGKAAMYGQSHLGSGLSGEQNSLQMGPIAGAQQTAMQQAISSAQQLGSVDQDMHDDGLDLLLDLNDKNDTEARGQQQDAQQQHDVITAAG